MTSPPSDRTTAVEGQLLPPRPLSSGGTMPSLGQGEAPRSPGPYPRPLGQGSQAWVVLGAQHIPRFGDCRIPTPSEAGALNHSDRGCRLPGMSCPCSSLCVWTTVPDPQAWDSSGPAQLSTSPTHNPIELLLDIWECWPTQKGGGVNSGRAHVESKHEFWNPINTDLNPGYIIYLLCNLGQVTQHL